MFHAARASIHTSDSTPGSEMHLPSNPMITKQLMQHNMCIKIAVSHLRAAQERVAAHGADPCACLHAELAPFYAHASCPATHKHFRQPRRTPPRFTRYACALVSHAQSPRPSVSLLPLSPLSPLSSVSSLLCLLSPLSPLSPPLSSLLSPLSPPSPLSPLSPLSSLALSSSRSSSLPLMQPLTRPHAACLALSSSHAASAARSAAASRASNAARAARASCSAPVAVPPSSTIAADSR